MNRSLKILFGATAMVMLFNVTAAVLSARGWGGAGPVRAALLVTGVVAACVLMYPIGRWRRSG